MQQRVPRQCSIAARPGHLEGKHTPEWQATACWYGPRACRGERSADQCITSPTEAGSTLGERVCEAGSSHALACWLLCCWTPCSLALLQG